MKNLIHHPPFYAIVILISFIMFSCEDAFSPEIIPPHESSYAKPEGNIVSLLNGDVVMEFPEGAVTTKTLISISECDLSDCSEFIIRPVEITPKTTFQKPVLLKIRFDCSLSNGNLNNNSAIPCGCCWNNEHQLLLNNEFLPLSCEIDRETKTLNMYINKTGVFAVKCNNQ